MGRGTSAKVAPAASTHNTAAAAAAAAVGGDYCEHTGFAFCKKCAKKRALAKAKETAKLKLATIKFVGSLPVKVPETDISSESDTDTHSSESASDHDGDDNQPPSKPQSPVRTVRDENSCCYHCCRRYTNIVSVCSQPVNVCHIHIHIIFDLCVVCCCARFRRHVC